MVISYALWQRLFGGARDAIGKMLEIDGTPHEVIGVMPHAFFFPNQETELWRPQTLDPVWDIQRSRRYTDWWRVVGRLKPGISAARAQSEMSGIGQQLEREYHTADLDFAGFGVNVVPMLIQVVGQKTPLLLGVLSAAVLALLLIACSNLGQLLLARGAVRQQEFAVRRALGAVLLLAAIASIAGIGFAFGTLKAMLRAAPSGIARLQDIRIDAGVFLFTAAVCVVAALLLGVVPAMHLSRSGPADSLRESERCSSPSRSRARTRDLLVAAEFALGVVLLFATTLFVRSYAKVQSADVGYRADRVFTARVSHRASAAGGGGLYRPLLERLKGLPGVIDAATVSGFFMELNPDRVITPEEHFAASSSAGIEEQLDCKWVSPGYFHAIGIRLLQGRLPSDSEYDAAVIDSEMARRYWPGSDPIGKRFKVGQSTTKGPWLTVIGVVGGTRRQGKEIAPIPEYYLVFNGSPGYVDFLVRTSDDPMQLASAFRAEVRALDKTAAVSRVTTLDSRLDEMLAPRRFETLLLTLFSILAMILAAIGVYGTTYYAVSQRVREIGVRVALGADSSVVVMMLLRQTSQIALCGVVVGTAAAVAVSRGLASLLYEVAPTDATAFTLVPAILMLIAVLAALVPACRASRIDPIVALRYQ